MGASHVWFTVQCLLRFCGVRVLAVTVSKAGCRLVKGSTLELKLIPLAKSSMILVCEGKKWTTMDC